VWICTVVQQADNVPVSELSDLSSASEEKSSTGDMKRRNVCELFLKSIYWSIASVYQTEKI
jgi:hypothetical protein